MAQKCSTLLTFIHLANAQEMMQSDSLEIDAFVERLETDPVSSELWHVPIHPSVIRLLDVQAWQQGG